jgi:predicted DNA-binding transcriptional regulator YafY
MYHPTTRVLALLALLQTHGRMTGAELASRLEVNIRTVREYIIILQDLGAPIVAERGRYGAYELDPSFKLPPMMFTEQEALALTMGLLAVRRLGLSEIIPAIESARAKLDQTMPPELKARMHALTETIMLDLDAPKTDLQSAVMVTMSRAAQLRRRVQMRYLSSRDEETERHVDPYGLAYLRGKWYVVGRCALRQDLRSFRMDRVIKADLTDTGFERPERFDVLEHVNRSIAILPRTYRFEVLLKIDLMTAQKILSNGLGVLEPHEDGVLLRGSAEDIGWVARELARLPCPFIIQTPDDLREALHQHAKTLLL